MPSHVIDPRDRMKRALARKRPRRVELVLRAEPGLTDTTVVELAETIFHVEPLVAVAALERQALEIATLSTTQEVGETKLVQAISILRQHGAPLKAVFMR